MEFPRFGLERRMAAIVAIVVISVVAVSTYLAMVFTRRLVEEELYRKAVGLTRATAHHLTEEASQVRQQAIEKEIQLVRRDLPGVRLMDVYLHHPTRRLVATAGSNRDHLELDAIPGIEGYFEYERPEEDTVSIESPDGKYWIIGTTVYHEGRDIGCVNLRVSKASTSMITSSLVRGNLLLLVASQAVVLILLNGFFLRYVRRPVMEMVRVMEEAERGRLDERARVSSRDEIGQLAAYLNRMLEKIGNFNTELAQRVEEATAELARRNEELRRINKELLATQKNLARSERLAVAGQLAASLAHAIGTPLNSISGHVQLLGRHPQLDEPSARRLRTIDNQIENIVRIVNQLLSWTRHFELKIEPLDLRHLLEETLQLTSPSLEMHHIHSRQDFPPAGPRIYGDAGYLQQVFLNLINNSIDAMPQGGELHLRLRPPAEGNDQPVSVEIADTGEGIPVEILPHIFEPMFTTKKMGSGAGLGLALAHQIVSQHGGIISVESEPGCGTKFSILLPVDGRQKLSAKVAISAASSPPPEPASIVAERVTEE